MKQFIYFFLFVIILKSSFAQDLPRHLTKEEQKILKDYKPPIIKIGFTEPPSKPVRTMAEWEELDGVIVTWTSYTSILRQIVDYAQDECTVYIVCSDSNSVKSFLTSGGVPLVNLKFIAAQYNSIWVRDYGPWTVYSNTAESLYVVDWIYNRPRPLDDIIPSAFANFYNVPIYQTTIEPYRLVNTGGNFMCDGHGNGFASKLILTDNPSKTEAEIDTIMKKFMGLNRYIKMTVLPYDGIHHIDMHMKLLDEETLLVGKYPEGISDGPQIEANLQYVINNFQTCYGRPFKVVRIPMPPDQNGKYPNQGGNYRTFTNSVILNKTVIVPTYDLQYDSTALRIYKEAMPGYNIVGINSNQIIPASGAIHCITKEVGVKNSIFISVHPIKTLTSTSFEVKAFIKSGSGIQFAKLFWSVDTSSGFTSVNMNQTFQDTFTAIISVPSNSEKIFYYVSAKSFSGKESIKPLTSPQGAYQFKINNSIPVELVNFYSIIEDNRVKLIWNTSSEKNNYGFQVERSFKLNGSNWQAIGFIHGNGTSNIPKNYSFIDNESINGKIYYRLKQIDFDGSTLLSSVIEIENALPNKFELYQNYPNPFSIKGTSSAGRNFSTRIKFQIAKKCFVSLKIFDLLGREVSVLINEEKEQGNYEAEFKSINEFSAGVYFYKLQAGAYSSVKKMIITK